MLEGGKAGGEDGPAGRLGGRRHLRPRDLQPAGSRRGYGYFWWVIDGGYAAEGIFGQQIFIYPAEKLVIAVNSAWPAASDDKLWKAQQAFAEAMRKAAR